MRGSVPITSEPTTSLARKSLLARAVFVVDREGVVRYVQIVNELTNEPDYDAALKAAGQLL